ncbi:flavin reductase [Kocuria arenosa]|uniref:flavin reductase n=1 Tax=Kocuria arenosa TaxID=3071446 RepID=UPI0034D63D15
MTQRSSKRAGTTGRLTPHLQGSLGWIDCELPQEIDGDDHVLILADVVEMTAIDTGDPWFSTEAG